MQVGLDGVRRNTDAEQHAARRGAMIALSKEAGRDIDLEEAETKRWSLPFGLRSRLALFRRELDVWNIEVTES